VLFKPDLALVSLGPVRTGDRRLEQNLRIPFSFGDQTQGLEHARPQPGVCTPTCSQARLLLFQEAHFENRWHTGSLPSLGAGDFGQFIS
jgi:hypothetical protein